MIEKIDNANPVPIEKNDAILEENASNYSKSEEKLLNLIAEIIVEIIMEAEE
ncbi:MAG TPA: hypothetical protein VGM63_25120 [Mucilaginibacter sp.]|jgi:hypothetical protein